MERELGKGTYGYDVECSEKEMEKKCRHVYDKELFPETEQSIL